MPKQKIVKIRYPENPELLLDEEIRRKVINAYENQVERNHGWGFTVKIGDRKVRFDVKTAGADPHGNYVVIYEGSTIEKSATEQTKLSCLLCEAGFPRR